jgi:hypothetical protein
MQLIFLYGQVASGKLTVARRLAAETGFGLFHNHLVVDAVGAVFPFGSEDFVRLRERWWLDAFEAAARTNRDLIFTFAPEPTVAADLPDRARALVEGLGGRAMFVALEVSPEAQEARLQDESRAAFGKLQSLELLRQLRDEFDAAMAAMPEPSLRIDTEATAPEAAARMIARHLQL